MGPFPGHRVGDAVGPGENCSLQAIVIQQRMGVTAQGEGRKVSLWQAAFPESPREEPQSESREAFTHAGQRAYTSAFIYWIRLRLLGLE